MLQKSAIARHLHADPSLVGRWVARGMPTGSLDEAEAWHAVHVRPRQKRSKAADVGRIADPSPVGDPVSRTWYDRRQRALALQAERELAQLEGRLVDREGALRAWQRFISNARTRLLAIPSRVAPLLPPAVRAKASAAIEGEVHAALEELARGEGRHERR